MCAIHWPSPRRTTQDLVGGGDLCSLLEVQGRLPETWVVVYAAEITLALEHVHAHKVIFRDLKPENVMIGIDGHLKLTDFGLSKQMETTPMDTKPAETSSPSPYAARRKAASFTTQTICGTPEYIAPEVLQGKAYGVAIDWWAYGCLVYEMVHGFGAFVCADMGTLVQQIIRCKLTFRDDLCSATLQDHLRSVLRREPKARLGDSRGVRTISTPAPPEAAMEAVMEGTAGLRSPTLPPSANAAVRDHEFFTGMDWEALMRKEFLAPCALAEMGRVVEPPSPSCTRRRDQGVELDNAFTAWANSEPNGLEDSGRGEWADGEWAKARASTRLDTPPGAAPSGFSSPVAATYPSTSKATGMDTGIRIGAGVSAAAGTGSSAAAFLIAAPPGDPMGHQHHSRIIANTDAGNSLPTVRPPRCLAPASPPCPPCADRSPNVATPTAGQCTDGAERTTGGQHLPPWIAAVVAEVSAEEANAAAKPMTKVDASSLGSPPSSLRVARQSSPRAARPSSPRAARAPSPRAPRPSSPRRGAATGAPPASPRQPLSSRGKCFSTRPAGGASGGEANLTGCKDGAGPSGSEGVHGSARPCVRMPSCSSESGADDVLDAPENSDAEESAWEASNAIAEALAKWEDQYTRRCGRRPSVDEASSLLWAASRGRVTRRKSI